MSQTDHDSAHLQGSAFTRWRLQTKPHFICQSAGSRGRRGRRGPGPGHHHGGRACSAGEVLLCSADAHNYGAAVDSKRHGISCFFQIHFCSWHGALSTAINLTHAPHGTVHVKVNQHTPTWGAERRPAGLAPTQEARLGKSTWGAPLHPMT